MITIPKPCSEDFEQMTPTEKGAFCSKCQKDTYDFRTWNLKDIKDLISTKANGELCGRIYKNQLSALNEGIEEELNQKSQFLIALIMGFGLSLFSCTSHDAQEKITFVQEIDSTLFVVTEVNEILFNYDIRYFDLRSYLIPTEISPPPLPPPIMDGLEWIDTAYQIDLPTIEIVQTVRSTPDPDEQLQGEIISPDLLSPDIESGKKNDGFFKRLFSRKK